MFSRKEASSKSFRERKEENIMLSKACKNRSNIVQPSKSSTAVLSAANRFPYSSTPAVSPNQNIKAMANSKTVVNFKSNSNENFKKPLISKKTASPIARKMSKNFPGNISASISPIQKASNNIDVFLKTQPRSTNDMPTSATAVGMTSFSSSLPRLSSTALSHCEQNVGVTAPFPFPNVEVETCNKLSKGELLLHSLKFLKIMRNIQTEERLGNRKEYLDQPTGKAIKKRDLKSESQSNFQFTSHMFKNVNSEASIHVLHLLFECYDSKQTDILFRDAWPVYEKKMEGVFRRVANKWLKDIMEVYPEFFPSMKLEAVGGLLVNPGGERFTQLIDSFSQLVMFRFAASMSSDDPSVVMKKPIFFDDSEITNRQKLSLIIASNNLKTNTARVRKQFLKNSYEVKKRITTLFQREERYSFEQSEIVSNMNRLWDLVKDSITLDDDELTDQCCDQLKPVLPKINHKIIRFNAAVDAALMAASKKALQMIEVVTDSHEEFEILWFILGMHINENLVLDGSRLLCLNCNDKSLPTFDDFIKTVVEVTSKILSDEYLNSSLASHVPVKYKSEDFKYQYLKIFYQKMNDRIDHLDLPRLNEFLEYKKQRLEVKLKNLNWHVFSKLDENLTNNKDFLITPPKGCDLKKNTGYTPRLLDFLPGANDEIHSVDGTHKNCNIRSGTRLTTGLERKTCDFSTLEMSPVSRFKSVGDRSAFSKVRLNIATNPSHQTTPEDKYRKDLCVPAVDLECIQEVGEISSVKVSINIENSSFSTLDLSVRSDSATPVGLDIDLSTQARIARIMGSLNNDTLHTPLNVPDFNQEDSNEETASNSTSTKVKKIISLNLSLMEDWNDEKGIMDVSYALDESDSDN